MDSPETRVYIMNKLFDKESDRLQASLEEAIRNGYVMWHSWDDPIRKDDSVIRFGFITFVKRAT